MSTPDELDTLRATRLSLQAVAEHILSAALHRATGRIGLRQSPGGFTTPPFPSPSGTRQIRVEGTDLVVTDDGGERRGPLTTIAAAGALAEIEPGAPADVYPPVTALDLDAPLMIDGAAADRLARWYALGHAALEQLRTDHADQDPALTQLWPEHFDLATSFGEVNYGVSPGDGAHTRPYLYVGPWTPPAPDGGYWNEPFGASTDSDQISTVADGVAFFSAGLR